jgi:hypothetical protein
MAGLRSPVSTASARLRLQRHPGRRLDAVHHWGLWLVDPGPVRLIWRVLAPTQKLDPRAADQFAAVTTAA